MWNDWMTLLEAKGSPRRAAYYRTCLEDKGVPVRINGRKSGRSYTFSIHVPRRYEEKARTVMKSCETMLQ